MTFTKLGRIRECEFGITEEALRMERQDVVYRGRQLGMTRNEVQASNWRPHSYKPLTIVQEM